MNKKIHFHLYDLYYVILCFSVRIFLQFLDKTESRRSPPVYGNKCVIYNSSFRDKESYKRKEFFFFILKKIPCVSIKNGRLCTVSSFIRIMIKNEKKKPFLFKLSMLILIIQPKFTATHDFFQMSIINSCYNVLIWRKHRRRRACKIYKKYDSAFFQ